MEPPTFSVLRYGTNPSGVISERDTRHISKLKLTQVNYLRLNGHQMTLTLLGTVRNGALCYNYWMLEKKKEINTTAKKMKSIFAESDQMTFAYAPNKVYAKFENIVWLHFQDFFWMRRKMLLWDLIYTRPSNLIYTAFLPRISSICRSSKEKDF